MSEIRSLVASLADRMVVLGVPVEGCASTLRSATPLIEVQKDQHVGAGARRCRSSWPATSTRALCKPTLGCSAARGGSWQAA